MLATESETFLNSLGAETVIYKNGVDERSIDAIVNRRQPAETGGAPHGKSPLLTIKVANDSTIGISSDEINLGQHLINLPINIGEAAQDRRITKILNMDSGMMKLEVR